MKREHLKSMRLLFEMDQKDYEHCTRRFTRGSARSIIIRDGTVAIIPSCLSVKRVCWSDCCQRDISKTNAAKKAAFSGRRKR